MITAKFGGTSVADAAAISRLVGIVTSQPEIRVVVVSALSGATDQLVSCLNAAAAGQAGEVQRLVALLRARHTTLGLDLDVGEHVCRHVEMDLVTLERLLAGILGRASASRSDRDKVMALGELMSSRLVAETLNRRGIPAVWIDARKVVVTDAQHTRAAVLEAETHAQLSETVRPEIDKGQVVVVGGFVGATVTGATTTLGRGGSDYSAAAIGSLLGCREIQIWTDVDGMLTADPRIIPDSQLVPHLSFAEASELAYFGAKVLHPSTIIPAMARDIPVRILNSHRPGAPSTLITARAPASVRPLRAIACKRNVTVIDITSTRMLMAHGFLRRVFEVFDRHETAVDVVTTSEVSVSVTIDDVRSLGELVAELRTIAEVSYESGLGLVCAVGERLRTDFTLCARILHALGGLPLRMVSQAASRQNITFVVAQPDLVTAMQRLHGAFFESPGPGRDDDHRVDAQLRAS